MGEDISDIDKFYAIFNIIATRKALEIGVCVAAFLAKGDAGTGAEMP